MKVVDGIAYIEDYRITVPVKAADIVYIKLCTGPDNEVNVLDREKNDTKIIATDYQSQASKIVHMFRKPGLHFCRMRTISMLYASEQYLVNLDYIDFDSLLSDEKDGVPEYRSYKEFGTGSERMGVYLRFKNCSIGINHALAAVNEEERTVLMDYVQSRGKIRKGWVSLWVTNHLEPLRLDMKHVDYFSKKILSPQEKNMHPDPEGIEISSGYTTVEIDPYCISSGRGREFLELRDRIKLTLNLRDRIYWINPKHVHRPGYLIKNSSNSVDIYLKYTTLSFYQSALEESSGNFYRYWRDLEPDPELFGCKGFSVYLKNILCLHMSSYNQELVDIYGRKIILSDNQVRRFIYYMRERGHRLIKCGDIYINAGAISKKTMDMKVYQLAPTVKLEAVTPFDKEIATEEIHYVASPHIVLSDYLSADEYRKFLSDIKNNRLGEDDDDNNR